MKHITKYLCENPKFLKDFKFWILRDNKKHSVKSYDGQFITKYNCWEGFLKMERTVVFFEWSNVNGARRYFTNMKDFYNFLEESHIEYPDYNMRKLIDDNDISYMACRPDKAALIHAKTKDELSEALNKLKGALPTPKSPHTMP